MSRPSCRLLANPASRITSLQQTLRPTNNCPSRPFSQTCARTNSLLGRMNQSPSQGQQQPQRPTGPPRPASAGQQSASGGGYSDLARVLTSEVMSRAQTGPGSEAASIWSTGASYSTADFAGADGGAAPGTISKQFENLGPPTEPFHFHVFSHKHNTHITVTKPNRGAILSMSAGQIGFRKAKRGTYDAGYQLSAYVMDKLNQGGWHKVIKSMEVVLRGFGHGREAATKVLLGAEGKMIRGAITKVSDATTLKFGGTRSPRPRRLG
ncbi:hypothetical protein SLS62_002459 [Diatrype stigma]|uniref:Uncharacterized protein n=1 Tax=Diatrype stigma TaxID=117547 RepID=A0AAN9UYI6_9PEZI